SSSELLAQSAPLAFCRWQLWTKQSNTGYQHGGVEHHSWPGCWSCGRSRTSRCAGTLGPVGAQDPQAPRRSGADGNFEELYEGEWMEVSPLHEGATMLKVSRLGKISR